MYKVILAPGAKQELRNALAHIRRKLRNPPAASHLADEAKATLRDLRTMPERTTARRIGFIFSVPCRKRTYSTNSSKMNSGVKYHVRPLA